MRSSGSEASEKGRGVVVRNEEMESANGRECSGEGESSVVLSRAVSFGELIIEPRLIRFERRWRPWVAFVVDANSRPHERSPDVREDVRLVQIRMHGGHEILLVSLGQQAPMQARVQVVDGVVAVVVAEEVEPFSGEIPREIHATVRIATVVLQHVQTHDAELRVDVGQERHDDPTLPIPDQQHGGDSPKDVLREPKNKRARSGKERASEQTRTHETKTHRRHNQTMSCAIV